jgi:hypothetical protein
VDECRRLNGLARALTAQVSARQPAQLVIDQRDKFWRLSRMALVRGHHEPFSNGTAHYLVKWSAGAI